jgi:hypothetical protein
MNKNQKKADLIYFLTLKYGSEYRTGVKTPNSLVNSQVKYLLDSRYCWEVECGIDCNIPYLFGGHFGWRLQSHDNIVCGVKALYEECDSQEAARVFTLRAERAANRPNPRISRRIGIIGNGRRIPQPSNNYDIVSRNKYVTTIRWK